MEYHIDYERGLVNRGNLFRLKSVMERAKKGEKLVIAFLGGSITQGFASSSAETCYAHRVFCWWKNQFPEASFVYINGGIGGTTSQFGVARVEEDILAYEPDFVITEFSVNDESNEHFLETYEGLIRKIYASKTKPAIMLVHNVYYNTGANAQLVHTRVGRHYELPCVSMQSTIYEQVLAGKIPNREITPDDLHPNDEGHRLVAEVITYALEKIHKKLEFIADEEISGLAKPITTNGYENSVRYRNCDIDARLDGFVIDQTEQKGITDCFKRGWLAQKEGDSIALEVEGSGISIQYRRYAQKCAPKAKVVIDGDVENAILLDGTFDLDWGDNLELTTIVEHVEHKKHSIKVTIVDAKDTEVPFYIVSFIVTK